MMKIFKKEVIIAFIVGIILASSIAVYAATINAKDVDYKDGKTVEYALNELYNGTKGEKKIITFPSSGNTCTFDFGYIPSFIFIKVVRNDNIRIFYWSLNSLNYVYGLADNGINAPGDSSSSFTTSGTKITFSIPSSEVSVWNDTTLDIYAVK